MADLTAPGAGAPDPGAAGSVPADVRLERERAELMGHCYRMLGSPFEAEDAVQETLLRAWRNAARFDEDRAERRSWLYAIATNVCLAMLRSARRRARAADLGPASRAGAPLGAPLPEDRWVLPIPDSRALPEGADPAELAVRRETIRLAFVAALQHLPPRQRAVLLLREVLCWRANEAARLLGTSVAAVNSALQRARSTMAARGLTPAGPFRPLDQAQQALLTRYVDAFQRYDVESLVSLLHEDAVMSMPPFRWWLRGRAEIRRALLGSPGACRGARLLPALANGSPAFGQYRPDPAGALLPWALVTLEVSGAAIAETTSYLAPAARLFALFGLPARLEP